MFVSVLRDVVQSVAASVFQFQDEPLDQSSQVTRGLSWVLPSRLHESSLT